MDRRTRFATLVYGCMRYCGRARQGGSRMEDLQLHCFEQCVRLFCWPLRLPATSAVRARVERSRIDRLARRIPLRAGRSVCCVGLPGSVIRARIPVSGVAQSCQCLAQKQFRIRVGATFSDVVQVSLVRRDHYRRGGVVRVASCGKATMRAVPPLGHRGLDGEAGRAVVALGTEVVDLGSFGPRPAFDVAPWSRADARGTGRAAVSCQSDHLRRVGPGTTIRRRRGDCCVSVSLYRRPI